MANQTLVFESAKELSLNNGMMVITDKITGEITLKSLEDIQMIMVDNHSVRISVPLIVRLVKNNVSIVYCDEKHMPVSMMMDLESNTLQSKRFQNQLSISIPTKKKIWKQIVEAKIRNQSLFSQHKPSASPSTPCRQVPHQPAQYPYTPRASASAYYQPLPSQPSWLLIILIR